MCYNLRDMKPTIDTTHPEAVKEWDYEKNDTTPNNYTHGSNYKAYWICPVGHSYTALILNKCSKGSACPYCSGRLPIPGETDLATTHPNLAKELVGADPKTLKSGTNKKVLWRCPQGHEYESAVCHRALKGNGCPYCSNQKVLIGFNDLSTTNPELATELVGDPTTITAGSNKTVSWKCTLNHTWDEVVAKRSKRNFGCPYCSGKRVLPGFNDLATTHPELSKELLDDPTTVSRGSRGNTWVCPLGHKYESHAYSRVKGYGCPICSGHQVLPGFNDLQTLYPEIAREMVEDPTTYTALSGRKATWKCLKGHVWACTVSGRVGAGSREGTGCPQCVYTSLQSKPEARLTDFIKEHYGMEVRTSDRKTLGGLELDIYLPDIKVAIEYNGLYWHSEKFRGMGYHKSKYDICEQNGIRMISVWEDDYRDNQALVHKMLLHKLGLSAQDKVPARKTEAVFISNQEAFGFLNDNHIQGKAQGSYYLGLKTKDTQELVAVMVLKRTKDVLSLERFATSKIVSGGQSKLLKFVDQNIEYSKMITFADRTVSDGGLYTGTGWVKETEIAPDYRYLVRNVREHKFGYRKDRFKKDPNLKYVEGYTEKQLAELNGLLRVYDAGKVRFSRVPQFRGRIDN